MSFCLKDVNYSLGLVEQRSLDAMILNHIRSDHRFFPDVVNTSTWNIKIRPRVSYTITTAWNVISEVHSSYLPLPFVDNKIILGNHY